MMIPLICGIHADLWSPRKDPLTPPKKTKKCLQWVSENIVFASYQYWNVRSLMASGVINLQRDTQMLQSWVTWVVVHWDQSKRAKGTIDWHTVNTNFISTSRNWYWCGTITLVEDYQSQRKIATHRIHERWFEFPKEICLGDFFYFPPWKKTRKENTSKREMRADLGHEQRRCLIKLLMSVAWVQIVLIVITIIVCKLVLWQHLVKADIWIGAQSNIFPVYFHLQQKVSRTSTDCPLTPFSSTFFKVNLAILSLGVPGRTKQ